MFQRVILAAVVAGLVLSVSGAPSKADFTNAQYFVSVHVENHTDRYAWITLYKGTRLEPWTIFGGSDNHPRCLAPHGSVDFTSFTVLEVKVRAEVKNGNCSGGTAFDTHDIRTAALTARASLNAGLYKTSNGFNLWFR